MSCTAGWAVVDAEDNEVDTGLLYVEAEDALADLEATWPDSFYRIVPADRSMR